MKNESIPTFAVPAMRWTEQQRAVFAVKADKDGSGPVEVTINGYIGEEIFDDGVMSEAKFSKALEGYERTRELKLYVNSMGGSVKAGLGIGDQIKRWEGKTTARITGFAVSIASVIPLYCDEVECPLGSNWMLHDPLCMTVGNAAEHQKAIEMLETCASTMAAIYADKTGKSRAEMRKVMRAETWFTAEQAVAFGLADRMAGDGVDMRAAFDIAIGCAPEKSSETLVTELLELFRNTPKRLVAALTHTPNPPATPAGQHTGNTMQKDKIIALLKQHGKTVAADATDEQLLGALNELVTAGKVKAGEAENLKQPEAKILINAEEFRRMEARLKEEKEHRIRQEFLTLAENRPYLDEKEWLPKIYASEDLLDTIRKMPIEAGGRPLSPSRVENNGNSLIEKYDAMEPGKERAAFANKHWHELKAAKERFQDQKIAALSVQEQLRLLRNPQAANTYSATLVTDHVANAVITTIGTRLAPINAFSRKFETDRLKPLAKVDVEKVTVASTTLTNATDFEQSDTTNVTTQVTVSQITQPWSLTNSERNSGHSLMTKAEKNGQAFANAISDLWTALLTTGNYGTPLTIGAAANFDSADLAPILAAGKNYGKVNLILDGGHLAYLLATDKFKFKLGEEGAYDFDLIAKQNRWTNAATNTVGFVCDPNAVAMAFGLPMELPDRYFLGVSEVTLDMLGITIMVAHWFSIKSRSEFMTFDIMAGAKEGDTTAAEYLITA